jgi:hypothetical protein
MANFPFNAHRVKLAHLELLAARDSHAAHVLDRAITTSVIVAAGISRSSKHAAVASTSRFCHRQKLTSVASTEGGSRTA